MFPFKIFPSKYNSPSPKLPPLQMLRQDKPTRQRKTLILIFLFVVIFSVTFFGINIRTAKASPFSDCVAKCAPLAVPGQYSQEYMDCYSQCQDASYGTVGSTSILANMWQNLDKLSLLYAVTNGIILGFYSLELGVLFAISAIANALLQTIIAAAIAFKYTTDNDAVQIGWSIVRNLANMMIVLGFVVIGIATSLRIKEYEAKQLLGKLIVVALLVNFSLIICGVFIDASNLLMKFFFASDGAITTWVGPSSSIGSLLLNAGQNPIDFLSKLLGMSIFLFISIFVDILYLILMLCRMVAIPMLVILSPLAFVCWVFPATKNVWNMWWKNFFQWCIIVLPAGLFYYIGSQMISKANGQQSIDLSTLNISADITQIFLPGMFLIVGFFVSLQSSAAGAGAILNFANKNKGAIMKGGLGALEKGRQKLGGNQVGGKLSQWGAKLQTSNNKIGKGAGWAVDKLGQTIGNPVASSQRTRSAFGRGLEAIGAVKTGKQAGEDQRMVEEEAKLASAAYNSNDPTSRARIEDVALHGSGAQRAGAIQALATEGKLHKVFKTATGDPDLDAIHKAIKDAEGFGASKKVRKTAQESMPELSAYNEATIDELAGERNLQTGLRNTANGKINPTTGVTFTEPEAMREAVRKTNADLSIGKIRDMGAGQMNINTAQDIDNRTFEKASQEFTTDQRRHLKGLQADITQRRLDLRTQMRALMAAGKTAEAEEVKNTRANLGRNLLEIRSWK